MAYKMVMTKRALTDLTFTSGSRFQQTFNILTMQSQPRYTITVGATKKREKNAVIEPTYSDFNIVLDFKDC